MDAAAVVECQVVEFTFGDDVIQGFVCDVREVRIRMSNGLSARIHDVTSVFRLPSQTTSSMLLHYVFRVRLHRFLIRTVDDYLAGARRRRRRRRKRKNAQTNQEQRETQINEVILEFRLFPSRS